MQDDLAILNFWPFLWTSFGTSIALYMKALNYRNRFHCRNKKVNSNASTEKGQENEIL